MSVKVIKNYREDATLRRSFNELAMAVHGIDFESWYQHGFWTERYNPYSVLVDGKIVANVSVNRIKMCTPKKEYSLIQLGTVMTYPEYRNRGYIRMLMEEIEKDYAGKVDGCYLFGNDTVLDFYPKFGFTKAEEFRAEKVIQQSKFIEDQSDKAKKISMKNQSDWDDFMKHIESSVPNSRFVMTDNAQLAMFYLSNYMKDQVYYVESQQAYVVAEVEDDSLSLIEIYADHVVDIDGIIGAFGSQIKEVKLGFTPLEDRDFLVVSYKEEDCTLFIKGDGWEEFQGDRFRFPELSHA